MQLENKKKEKRKLHRALVFATQSYCNVRGGSFIIVFILTGLRFLFTQKIQL